MGADDALFTHEKYFVLQNVESKPELIFRNPVSLFLSYIVKEACVYVIRTREKENLGQYFIILLDIHNILSLYRTDIKSLMHLKLMC